MNYNVNIPQNPDLIQAMVDHQNMQQKQQAAQQMMMGNGWGGGAELLGAALGGFLNKKYGEQANQMGGDIQRQIQQFQAQKEQEMAAAEQAKADAEYKRKLKEQEAERAFELKKQEQKYQLDQQNAMQLQQNKQQFETQQTQAQREYDRANKEPDYKSANDLRKEFQNLKPVKDFDEVNASFQKVVSSAQNPSAASDIALITGFMKMNDPGSTVREGEFATAANAGGVSERIRNTYNSLLDGQRLTEDQRANFVQAAGQLYGAHADQYQRIRGQYDVLAQNMQLDPNQVFIQRKIQDWQEQNQQQEQPPQPGQPINPAVDNLVQFYLQQGK